MSRLQDINEQRELMNYEYSHLYNLVRHGSKSHLFSRRTLIQRRANSDDQAEYGIFVEIRGRKRLWRLASLERCLEERARHPESQIVRLGRDSRSKAFDVVNVARSYEQPDPRFIALTDESGNIESPVAEEVQADVNVYQLISNELTSLRYVPDSLDVENPKGCRPPAVVLRNLHMRYNDIVPEDFAAAVVMHCELPRVGEGKSRSGKNPFKSTEEKEAWFNTPAGQVWVKENPVPSIFALPIPDYLHRRG